MAKKVDEEDIKRLRKAIGLDEGVSEEAEPEFRENIPEEGMPAPPQRGVDVQEPEVPRNMAMMPPPVPRSKAPEIPVKVTSPENHLFVKLENHTEIAAELVNIKKDIEKTAETLSILAKAEKLKSEATEKLEFNLNELEVKIHEIDRQLVSANKLGSVAKHTHSPEDDISGLNSSLNSLKSKLSEMDNQ